MSDGQMVPNSSHDLITGNNRYGNQKFFYRYLSLMLCLCQHKKRAPKNIEINPNVKRPLGEQRKMFGARI